MKIGSIRLGGNTLPLCQNNHDLQNEFQVILTEIIL